MELLSKSNPTRMISPGAVFVGNARDIVLAVPGDAFAMVCTDELP